MQHLRLGDLLAILPMEPVHLRQSLGSPLAVHGPDEELGRDETGVVDTSAHVLGRAELACVHEQTRPGGDGERLQQSELPAEDVDEWTVVQHGHVHNLVRGFVVHCIGVFEEGGIFTLEFAEGAEAQHADQGQVAENSDPSDPSGRETA